MELKDLGGILTKLAPTLATTLGGPLAGSAVAALEAVFGIKAEGTAQQKQEALVEAVSGATPDQLLALKKADQEHAEKMAELGFKSIADLDKLAAEDRDSARKREIEVKDKTPRNLAYIITAGFFGVLGFLMFKDVPAGSRDILNIMLGSLGTAWIGVVGYYYGTTEHSNEKTSLLAKAQPVK